MSRKTMKKFWNLMLVALVMLGAAACTENESVDVNKEEVAGLSFYAEIVNDATRADLEYDEESKLWNTVWEANDVLSVVHYDDSGDIINEYKFTNSAEEPNKFTCTTEGVESIIGGYVYVDYTPEYYSDLGKKGICAHVAVPQFDITEPVMLEAKNSFLRYTYNGTGNVTLSLEGVDENMDLLFFSESCEDYSTTITRSETGENWVSVLNMGNTREVVLSYSIDGVKCKETTIQYSDGKIYNLGTLEMPYETSVYSVVGTHNGWAAGKTPMYLIGDYAVAYGVEFTDSSNAFKVLGNDKWLGVASLSLGTWTSLTVDTADMTLPAGKYDFYFSETRTMLCVVEAGAKVPELAEIEWALAGNFNNWGNTTMAATEVANLFVAKGVELTTGTAIKVKDAATWDTSYGGGISNLEANKWMTVYSNGADIVIAKSGTYDVYFQYGATAKLYLIEADGDYTAATEQTANGTLVPDEIETPEEVVPGVASEWALVGVFSGWADKAMLTTTDANVVVLQNVAMKAAEGFLVRKPATEWNDKYGAGDINYIKANHYITTNKGGADMCLEADGTYDVYFNISTKNIYVMAAGVDYTAAAQQTVNGEEPKQEEPEVTEKVVYLKPNSNWKQSNARFAAYFWGGTTGEKWVSMTDEDNDGIYEVHLPEGYDYGCNIIFCRMNPSTTANNWNNKWNQTSDLKTPTDGKNMYTIAAGAWDKGSGSWSVK